MRTLIRPQVPLPAGRASLSNQPVRVPLDLGPAPIDPSQPGALGAQQGVWVRLPGANFPPAGATPVDELGDANIAAGGTGLFVTITVPDGQRFRMAGIGFGADDETALAFLSWTINAPDPTVGYINKAAAIGSIRNVTPIIFLVGSSVVVTVTGAAALTAVVTYRYICRVQGWFYSEMEA